MDTVKCHSGSEYAERPLALTWQGCRLEVAEILARWRAPHEKAFRIKTTDGRAFDLTYREISEEWHIQPL
jgi:hypothetical protein